jgi:hypothetical protein
MATKAKPTRVLSRLLEKRGIADVKDLAPEEQATLEKWKLVLTGATLTVDTLKEFCQSQLRVIESKCDGVTPLTTLQQASMHVYINLLKAIEAPEAERASLERYLTQIVNA